jgi:hypothetical protein
MKRNAIIDYLNFASAFKLIKNERGSNVIALFRPQSKSLELLLIKIIGLFGIGYSLNKIVLARNADSIAPKILDRTGDIVRSVSNEYIQSPCSKVNECFDFNLKKWLFDSLWRQIFIIEYVKGLNINIDAIYISSQISNELLVKSSFYQSELSKGLVIHYKSSSLIADKGYSYAKKQHVIKYIGKNISTLIEFFYACFFVRIRRKVLITPIDFLVFAHSTFKWLSLGDLIYNSTLKSKVVYPNDIVGSGKEAFHLKSIYWLDTYSFYRHMFIGMLRFRWAINISIKLFFELLTRWKYVYIIQSLYINHDVKIVLSGYESVISQVAVAVAADNTEIASFDCVWSIGVRPDEFASTQNSQSDRFFLWGCWHHDLMRASNDESRGHILAGYIGDAYIPLMKANGKKFRDKELNTYNKIVTVFDSGASEDMHPEAIYFDYLKAIMSIAEDINALVVLKVKNINRYTKFIKSLNTERLILHYEKGSFEAALNSDLVTGVVNSGMASISAAHGRQVVLYDPTHLVWDQWETYSDSCTIARSIPDLKNILRERLSYGFNDVTHLPKYIDPYCDGKAQQRMNNYIQNVFDNLHLGKSKALHLADNIYKDQWGDDKVLENDFLNKELNEENNI